MNDKGMTLVEAAVAMVMFAVVAVSLFGVYWQGLRLERRSMTHTLAVYTAQAKIEEAYGMSWRQLTSGFAGETAVQAGGVDFAVVCGVRRVSPEDMGLAAVSVTVSEPGAGVSATFEGIVYAP